MAAAPLTAEESAAILRTVTEKFNAMMDAQRESAHRQDAFAARMETFGARLDLHSERFDQMNQRISDRLDRMEEQLSQVYEIVTRKKAGFAR